MNSNRRPKLGGCLLALLALMNLSRLTQSSNLESQAQHLQQPPSITPFSFNQNVQENQRAIVMCTTSSGDQPISFTWLKDGQALSPQVAQARRITIRPDTDSSTLKISLVRLEHAGNYTCLAKNRFGSQTHSTQLVVHSEPRWVKEPHSEPIVTTRGQTVVIDCQTTGWPRPQQMWFFKTHQQGEFEPLATSIGGRITLAQNGSLVIRRADKSDEANYLCKSSNGIGKGLEWSISLKVTVPAHFETSKQQQTSIVRKQSQVQLRCDAFGDQPIAIEWYKNKQALTHGELSLLADARYSIHSNNNPLKNGVISQLLIRQAQRQDNSIYECVTKNQYGRDRLAIELIVQEEPDFIQELQVTAVNSRSVTLMWSEPYDGRSPITSYMFQYKRVQDVVTSPLMNDLEFIDSIQQPSGGNSFGEQHLSSAPLHASGLKPAASPLEGDWQHANRLVLPMQPNSSQTGSERSITIEKLEPSSKYILRALAINSIGQSKFSPPMEFSTDEEAPAVGPVNIKAVAINSTSIQVSWDEIPRSKHLGRIHGYYIGYRVASNNTAAANFIYKPYIISDLVSTPLVMASTVANGGSTADTQNSGSSHQQQVAPAGSMTSRLETVLQDLRRDTVYEITVVAFNSRGSGPSSDFVVCRTIEMDAPKPVKLTIRRESNESIFVEWQPDQNDQNPVDDYVLYQEKNSASQEWLQVRLPGNQTHYKAPGLKCGTRYQFYIIAHNKVGKSLPSDVVSASTSGALPVIPSKTSLIKWINSTCLLINLNSFQDNGCRIKTFTVRYRVEKIQPLQQSADMSGMASSTIGSGSSSQAIGSSAGSSGQLIGANGMSATHQALTTAGQLGGKAVLAGQTGYSSTPYASEWIAIRPKSNLKQQRANEEDRMEYLCDLSPVGEYTIHVAAANDVGRSEIEYTVLMSSDELRHSALRSMMEFFSGFSTVFAYIPSLLVFLLAALLLVIVALILYTTAIKYYQKFVIMQNQMRATRRAKADEKRRQKFAQASRQNGNKFDELWANEFDDGVEDLEEGELDDEDIDDDDCGRMVSSGNGNNQGRGRSVQCSSQDSVLDGDDEDETTATEELQSSSSGNSGRVMGRRAAKGSKTMISRHASMPASHHSHYLNPQHQRRQLSGLNHHQHSNYSAGSHGHHYLSNIANSAFDTSSIDSPCNSNKGKLFNGGNGSTCMSDASSDSIHGRFQCLNSKQYVKMNEYTMLPSISASLAQNDIYGAVPTSMAAAPLIQSHLSPASQMYRPLNGGSPNGQSSASNTTTTASTGPSQTNPTISNPMYYSTLRRTNMQTYLPRQQQQQQQEQSHQQQRLSRRPSQNVSDIYGYYMAPSAGAHTQVAVSAAAAQHAANEAANSIFVPPQQIIYSAPNIRRQPPVFL